MGRTDDRSVRIPLPPGHWWVTEIRAAVDQRLGIRRPGLRDLARELAERGTVIDDTDRIRDDLREWADLGAVLAGNNGEVFAEALQIVRELAALAVERNASEWRADRTSDVIS